MSQLTPWYPPHIKPVRVGVYNASMYRNESFRSYWDGKCWSWRWAIYDSPDHVKRCKKLKRGEVSQKYIYWRGLSAAPTPEDSP